jgi:tRNA(His) 5'-end guanylyltransferase
MLDATERLMTCGFKIRFGYCQSDEISLLRDPAEDAFGRRAVKLASVFAGEASAALTLALGRAAAFDGRVVALPDEAAMVAYFRWRKQDARRNALNAYCYWAFRRSGKSGRAADRAVAGVDSEGKISLLFRFGVNALRLPSWQDRGVGVRWVEEQRIGHNPITGEDVAVVRRRLQRDLDLPFGEALEAYLRALLRGDGSPN